MRIGVPHDADFLVRGYAPHNKGGHLLVETWHRGAPSKDGEVAVWLARRARGEAGRIEVEHRFASRTEEIP